MVALDLVACWGLWAAAGGLPQRTRPGTRVFVVVAAFTQFVDWAFVRTSGPGPGDLLSDGAAAFLGLKTAVCIVAWLAAPARDIVTRVLVAIVAGGVLGQALVLLSMRRFSTGSPDHFFDPAITIGLLLVLTAWPAGALTLYRLRRILPA